ncbi:alpha/beta hydrolase [Kribbella sandramycini]|uniref:Alpha/beta hydrolase n=1 Tax=Kribbella sandramycini TaxID=60450 RepID=A0A7Y4L0Y9_9ACTN|nr:alpha/beta hydrolase [Kribbella sandramycini]MBB6565024.1 lipase [Kribbella sandramycini]NOL41296.1 alpha/beta hydrolase [Kribbella sandramycini]
MIWILLPGMTETPEEFGPVLELVPGADVRVIDPWVTPVNADPAVLRAAAGVPAEVGIGLIGHSIGGLAALRWALSRPGEVERLVLVDSTLPSETGHRRFYPGTRADRIVRGFLGALGWTGLPWLLGPVIRRTSVRVGSVTKRDPLSKAIIKRRYGVSSSWQQFWDELAASWVAAEQVGKLLAQGPDSVVLVAVGGGSRAGADSWLAGQRELAGTLGGRVEVLADSAHLVHLDRPDAIAAAIR